MHLTKHTIRLNKVTTPGIWWVMVKSVWLLFSPRNESDRLHTYLRFTAIYIDMRWSWWWYLDYIPFLRWTSGLCISHVNVHRIFRCLLHSSVSLFVLSRLCVGMAKTWYNIIDDITWRSFAVFSLSDAGLLGNHGIQPFLSWLRASVIPCLKLQSMILWEAVVVFVDRLKWFACAIDGVVFIHLQASRLHLTYLPVTYSLSLPLLPSVTLYFVVYLLAWMDSTVSLPVTFILYLQFSKVISCLGFHVSIVIYSHSFLAPSLVGLDSLGIDRLSKVTDYSVRLAVRKFHYWRS